MTIKVSYTYASPVYINIGYGTVDGGAVWGDITGTLSNQADLQAALNAKVPYSGATGNVNLGEYELKAGQLTLDTSPTGTATVATMRWNDTTGLTETTLKGGSVVLKNGVDLVARVVNKVTPNTTLTKAAYQAVRVSGAQGQRLAIELAQANNDNNSADTIGLVTETIATNQEGFIMTVGQLEGINTTGSLQGETWVDGDVLYLSPTTAGALTNVKPVAPQHLVIIGYVEYAHANNGKIYVKVMNGWELGELHDVNTTGATNGSVLKYNGSIWVPSSDIDTGITTLNTLTALSQSFATGTSGTDFNISSATSTHTFNLPSASATNRGLLTSADWTTFNNKQNALTNPVTGTGVSGQVAYWSGTNTQTGSNNLFWDNASVRLGIGRTPTARRLEIQIANGSVASALGLYDGGGALQSILGIESVSTNDLQIAAVAGMRFYTSSTLGNVVTNPTNERMRLFNSGNLHLGGTTDSGQRFQVTGDGYFSGSVGIGTSSLTGVSLRVSKNITGSATSYGIRSDGTIQSDVTGQAFGFDSSLGTQAAAFNLTILSHYRADQATIGAGSTVETQYGFQARANLIGATNNYGFFGSIPAGTGRWNLYMGGSADNYLAGSLGIGSASLTSYNLRVTKNITGSSTSTGIYVDGAIQNDVTAQARGIQISPTIASGTAVTDLIYYFARQNTFTGTATNQFGFFVDNNLTSATNNYGFYGNLASGTGRWNLYMNGSADNYMAGNLLIGTTTNPDGHKLFVNGGRGFFNSGIRLGTGYSAIDVVTGASGLYLSGSQGALNHLFINSSGNLGLGVTPSAWQSTRAMQMGYVGSLAARTGGSGIYLSSNVYFVGDPGANAANARYIDTTTAGSYAVIGNNHYWFTAPSGTANANITMTQAMTLFATGNLAVGTTTDAGFKLDVNGTMKVSDSATFTKAYTNTSDFGIVVSALIPGINLRTTATGRFSITSNYNNANSTSFLTSTGTSNPTSVIMYFDHSNNRVGINNVAPSTAFDVTGAATFSSSVTAASYTINDAGNITIGTTTGTKIGTATSQKIGFWNATPIVQPTTAVAAAAFVANTGTAVNDASTFDGYTMAQIVKALRNAGLLA